MRSYGYHKVLFEGPEAARKSAGTKLAAGLNLDDLADFIGPKAAMKSDGTKLAAEPGLDSLADRRGVERDVVYFNGRDYSGVVDDTLAALSSIVGEGSLREIRYHAYEGDAGGSFSWLWTAEGGGRTLEDAGTFTMSFEEALAVDRLVSSGEGRPELARRLIADPISPLDISMIESVERLGLYLLAFDGSLADEITLDELSALVRDAREFLGNLEGDLEWLEDDKIKLSDRLGIAEAAVEAGRLSAEARPGREWKARPKL